MNFKYISNKVVMKSSRKSFSYRRTASGILEIIYSVPCAENLEPTPY